jgi:opacity protein-like surface antigen
MKRFVALLFVSLVVMGVASEVLAQVDQYLRRPHRVTVGVEGGLSIPATPSEFSDRWNTTWPFSIGVGFAVFSWLEVAGGLTYGTFGISEIPAKNAIGVVTTAEIQGGDVSMLEYWGSARFVAVPNQRTNPFAEIRLGVFKMTADDLEVEETTTGPTATPAFTNEMEDANGVHFAFGGGIQYALNDNWTAYTKYLWSINLDGDFTPSSLLLPPPPSTREVEGDNMSYSTVLVGILIRL